MTASADMDPLLERGLAALVAFHDALPPQARPIGATRNMDIVLMADFCANVELCFRHVESSGRPMHVLCAHEVLCLRVEKIIPWRRP